MEDIETDADVVHDKLHELNLNEPEIEAASSKTNDVDNDDSNHNDRMKSKLRQVFISLIGNIDKHVLELGESQSELNRELNDLLGKLDRIKIDESLTNQICANAKRIANLKSRMIVCHNILNNSSDRCNRILTAASNINPTVTSTTNNDHQVN